MPGFFDQQDEFSDQAFEALEEKGSIVDGSTFEDCVFVKCSFTHAVFKGCRFVDCQFDGCDLSNLQVTASVFRGTSFNGSKLIGVNWANAASVSRLSFDSSRLDLSSFVGMDLRNTRIHACSAREADFADSNLSDSDCSHTDFAGARFANTNLKKADFRLATNYSIRPLSNQIKKARFSLPEATLLLYGLDIVLDE